MKSLRICAWALAFASCLGAVTGALAAPRYRLQAIAPLEVSGGEAWFGEMTGFNDAGQIAMSWYHAGSDGGQGLFPYLYSRETGYQALMPPSARGEPRIAPVHDLNAGGVAVGQFWPQAYIFRPEGRGESVPLDGSYGVAYSINDRGDVAGLVGFAEAAQPFVRMAGGEVAVLPRSGAAVDINNNGQVLVLAQADGPEMFLHDASTGRSTMLVAGMRVLSPYAFLNDQGDVAMTVHDEIGLRVQMYRDGRFSTLAGSQGDVGNVVYDFNNAGWVLGTSALESQGPGRFESFLHVPNAGSFTLQSLIDPSSTAGWTDLLGFEMNEQGDIAGRGTWGGQVRPFVLNLVAAPVPEPSSAALALAGLALLARIRPRSREPEPRAPAGPGRSSRRHGA
jgi:MYXO-CTERM domain-containing protein